MLNFPNASHEKLHNLLKWGYSTVCVISDNNCWYHQRKITQCGPKRIQLEHYIKRQYKLWISELPMLHVSMAKWRYVSPARIMAFIDAQFLPQIIEVFRENVFFILYNRIICNGVSKYIAIRFLHLYYSTIINIILTFKLDAWLVSWAETGWAQRERLSDY